MLSSAAAQDRARCLNPEQTAVVDCSGPAPALPDYTRAHRQSSIACSFRLSPRSGCLSTASSSPFPVLTQFLTAFFRASRFCLIAIFAKSFVTAKFSEESGPRRTKKTPAAIGAPAYPVLCRDTPVNPFACSPRSQLIPRCSRRRSAATATFRRSSDAIDVSITARWYPCVVQIKARRISIPSVFAPFQNLSPTDNTDGSGLLRMFHEAQAGLRQ